jgi:nucleoside-diphosphate-sugar epimerase
MNILLTGSNGFLGSYILSEIENNNKIFTLNRSNSDYNVDLENSEIKFDVNLTKNLLNSLEQSKLPKYFIFISSVSVYRLVSGKLIKEDHP